MIQFQLVGDHQMKGQDVPISGTLEEEENPAHYHDMEGCYLLPWYYRKGKITMVIIQVSGNPYSLP